jgi:hypothetical protein
VAIADSVLDRLSPNLDAWLTTIDAIALTQAAPAETMNRILASGLPILDLASNSVFAPKLMGVHA